MPETRCGMIPRLLDWIDAHKKLPDRIAAVLLALCPILQHYRAPFFNAALTVLICLTPYLFWRALPELRRFRWKSLLFFAPIIVYYLYRIIDHGTSVTETGQSGLFILYMVALSLCLIDLKFFIKAGCCIALTASAGLLLQYIGFYIFGFHIKMVPTSLLLPSAEQWILCVETGLSSITGRINDFYRPAAFFLEPSHFFLYSFPHLFLLLFRKGRKRDTLLPAAILSLGMVLSTSAMGLVAMIGAWGIYLAFWNEKEQCCRLKNILRPRNLIAIGALLLLALAAFFLIPSVNRTVTRIFSTRTGVTAISGRIRRALGLLPDMTARQWIFGVADNTRALQGKFNIPGVIDALYRHGLIGLVLSYEFYFKNLFCKRISYALVALMIIGVSFFSAHTHSTVGMLNFVFILMSGYAAAKKE